MNSSSNIHGSCQSTSSSAASSDCGYSCSSCSLSVESVEQQQVEAKTELLITSLDLPGTMSSSSTSASALSSHQEDLLVLDSRDFYARRIQSLERFRHRCAQKIEESSAAEGRQQIAKEQEQHPESPSDVFARLQSDMVSLMESDVSLTHQLITLGERIEELKLLSTADPSPTPRSPLGLSSASSMITLDGIDEEDLKTIDDDAGVTLLTVAPLAGSFSDDDGDGEDDDEVPSQDSSDDVLYAIPQKEYFSRQNSILRIPIPPSRRRTPRTSSSSDHRPCASIIKRASNGSASTTSSSDDGVSSGMSSVSSSFMGWYTRKRSTTNNVDRVRVVSAGSMPSTSYDLSGSHHKSQGSCDSGIHQLNNSLEVLDKEEMVYV